MSNDKMIEEIRQLSSIYDLTKYVRQYIGSIVGDKDLILLILDCIDDIELWDKWDRERGE